MEPNTERIDLKPGNVLYPLPAVMVSCGDMGGETNIITIAWTGTACSDPPMVYISVQPKRHSFEMIRSTGEFVINLVTEELARAMDFCGVRSGRDIDKWEACGLTPLPGKTVRCPIIAESPVSIECRVVSDTDLGSHHMFLSNVTAVRVDGQYMSKRGALDFDAMRLVAYNHGSYNRLGKKLGTFGYSVKKRTAKKKREQK